MSFEIITDSASDLSHDYVKKHRIEVCSLKYSIGGLEYDGFYDKFDEDYKNFYARIREKEIAVTSGVNPGRFKNAFEKSASKGFNSLYIGFSSALSITYNSAVEASKNLQEKYPARKMFCVDTLSASLGEGLLVDTAVEMRAAGASIEETRDELERIKLQVCHWFTVNDLFSLKRGGRIGTVKAVAGTVFGIKPVLRVDDEGKLDFVKTIRGRKNSIDTLISKIAENIAGTPPVRNKPRKIFIAHGDALDEAKLIAKTIKHKFGIHGGDIMIETLSPVIGAHSGAGTLAVFFYGEKR